ncbi:hypothetical protein SS50377_20946 [Spironucleus salmonicida]|uniref:Uncharacterized protein n=1 Tax=Spironucleus salmonicida TaxID=348837 RepID=V6LS63_9EUKA|nr:hypothetical protein SS50377_20946 [Spironucleus salmonicida]|eukprot:EST43619.1 Hypothetical protein SS50377_16661 [Spironucleus salmonicida]
MRQFYLNVKIPRIDPQISLSLDSNYIPQLSMDINEPNFSESLQFVLNELKSDPIRIASAENIQDLVYNSLLVYYDSLNYNNEVAFSILSSLAYYRPEILLNFKLHKIYQLDLSRMLCNLKNTLEQAYIILQVDLSTLRQDISFYEILYQISLNQHVIVDYQADLFKFATNFQNNTEEIVNYQLLILQQLLQFSTPLNEFFIFDFTPLQNFLKTDLSYNTLQCIFGLQTLGINLQIDVVQLLSPYHSPRVVELCLYIILYSQEPSKTEIQLSLQFLTSKHGNLRNIAALIAENYGGECQRLVKNLKLTNESNDDRYIKAVLKAIINQIETDLDEFIFLGLKEVLLDLKDNFGIGVGALCDDLLEVLV